MPRTKYTVKGVFLVDSNLQKIPDNIRFPANHIFKKSDLSPKKEISRAVKTFGKQSPERIFARQSTPKHARFAVVKNKKSFSRLGTTTISQKYHRIDIKYSCANTEFRCPKCSIEAFPVTDQVRAACRRSKVPKVAVQCSFGHWAMYSCRYGKKVFSSF